MTTLNLSPSTERFDACIFDLDGTLLDTLPDLVAVTNSVLAKFGFPQHSREAILSFVGNGGRRLIEQAVPGNTPDEVVEKAFCDWKLEHERIGMELTCEYEGITAALKQLKKRGKHLAVLSNKYDSGVQEVIPHFFPGIFEVLHGECEQIPRKPNPAGLALTMYELGVSPDRTVYVGDSRGDMVVASAAKTTALGVAWGYQSREELVAGGADYVATSAEDMLAYLLS